mmetsp:Transcript_88911/g.287942  ORF Transcript_88911/g.287942 Transcript_88911/m.287942 type:complete len:200 (+) Transcript_88911:591-1190(+)
MGSTRAAPEARSRRRPSCPPGPLPGRARRPPRPAMAAAAEMPPPERTEFPGKRVMENTVDHFTLRVRNPSGQALQLQVAPRTTVLELKGLIEAAEGTAVQEQRLLVNGMVMVDERRLSSYRLGEGSTVLHVAQLRATVPATRTTLPKHELAPHVNRGFLMVPGCGGVWKPETAGKVSAEEHAAHFDSASLPPPWKVQSS